MSKEFAAHLTQLRKDIFDCAFDPDICGFATVNDLAVAAGLDWKTVDRLYRGKTKRPAYSTLYALCKAIKMPIRFIKLAQGSIKQNRRPKSYSA